MVAKRMHCMMLKHYTRTKFSFTTENNPIVENLVKSIDNSKRNRTTDTALSLFRYCPPLHSGLCIYVRYIIMYGYNQGRTGSFRTARKYFFKAAQKPLSNLIPNYIIFYNYFLEQQYLILCMIIIVLCVILYFID